MKRYLIALAVLCTISISVSYAQELTKGGNLLNVGVGVEPGFGFNVSYDYGLVDTWGPGIFTIGGFAGLQSRKLTKSGFVDYRTNHIALAVRCSYRYQISDSFEVFGVAMTGFGSHSYSKHFDNENKAFWAVPIVGCRYTFASNISVFGEVGWSLSWLNGGLSFSF